jgi:hypothetical protein
MLTDEVKYDISKKKKEFDFFVNHKNSGKLKEKHEYIYFSLSYKYIKRKYDPPNNALAASTFYLSLEKEAEKKVLNFHELVRLTTRIYKIGTQEFFSKGSF